MTTLLKLPYDGETEGTTCDLTNTAIGGTGVFAAIEGSSVFAAQAAHYGAFGVKGPAAGTSSYGRCALTSTTFQFRVAFRFVSSLPSADATICRVTDSAGTTTYYRLEVAGTGHQLRIRNAAGTVIWTAAAAVVADTWYVVRGCVDMSNSTSTGKHTIAYHSGWSPVAIEGPTEQTAQNFGGVAPGRYYTLKNTSTAPQQYNDNDFLGDVYALPDFYRPTAAATSKAIGSFASNAGAWALTGAGVYTAEQALGDGSDSTGIVSPGSASNEAAVVRLAPITTTGTLSWTFRLGLPSGSTATTAKIDILQGVGATPTVVATRTFNDLTETLADKVVTLTPTEKAAITDATDLGFRIYGNAA